MRKPAFSTTNRAETNFLGTFQALALPHCLSRVLRKPLTSRGCSRMWHPRLPCGNRRLPQGSLGCHNHGDPCRFRGLAQPRGAPRTGRWSPSSHRPSWPPCPPPLDGIVPPRIGGGEHGGRHREVDAPYLERNGWAKLAAVGRGAPCCMDIPGIE